MKRIDGNIGWPMEQGRCLASRIGEIAWGVGLERGFISRVWEIKSLMVRSFDKLRMSGNEDASVHGVPVAG